MHKALLACLGESRVMHTYICRPKKFVALQENLIFSSFLDNLAKYGLVGGCECSIMFDDVAFEDVLNTENSHPNDMTEFSNRHFKAS